VTSLATEAARACQSPSDLVLGSTAPVGERLRVGGRVLSRNGERGLKLADALAVIEVELEAPHVAKPGDLVEVEGTWSGTLLAAASCSWHQSAPESRGDGEFARFTWQALGPMLRVRARALRSIRAYFENEAFVEVSTPLRVPTPGLDANVQALRADPDWLITSPEFHMKRLLVGGMPRIFQLTPCFRADESGVLHEPEFTMLEWYRAFADYDAVLRDTEELVYRVVRAVSGQSHLRSGDSFVDVTPPFLRLTLAEAFERHAGVSDVAALALRDESRFFELLVGRVEPALAQLGQPVFLTEYPACQAALARKCPHDPSVAERFELYVGGVELCNGFSELTDATEQRQRFEAELERRAQAGQAVYALDEKFLRALHEGMPRSAGNALGIDRLLMLATGAPSLAHVIAFPNQMR